MAKYDTTGPVTVDERVSLFCFLGLLVMVGTGAWLGLELRALPAQRQAWAEGAATRSDAPGAVGGGGDRDKSAR
jgi:hypothetical protein